MLEKFYYKKDRLNQIRGFCAVVRFGSVNRAARNLNLEAATVSKQIITLERDIGLELFDRTNKRKLLLNDNGKRFYNNAVKVLQSVDGLFEHFYTDLKMDNIKDPTYQSSNAYGVLFEHYGICSGYADTLAIFLNKLGIINYKISNDEHIWNLAYINNKWTHIDLTWDDPVSEEPINRSDYFMIDTKTLQELDDEHEFNKYIFEEAK